MTSLTLAAAPVVARAAQEPAPAAPASTQEAPALKDDQAKSSYAVGMNLGAALRRQSPDLDLNLIVQGFRDALAGDKTLLSPLEVRTILRRLQAEQGAKQAALQNENAAKAAAESAAFLAENKARQGVVTLESGLQYRILKAADGKKPTIGDTVVCNYRGTLVDGTQFDSSYEREAPATLALKKVIKGWAEALQLMPMGSKWQLFIPPSLAYGERGSGKSIGPNAALIFEVELLAIEERPAATASAGTRAAPERPRGTSAGAASTLADISVSFKLDPRITKSLYMGDRWVPLPFQQAGQDKRVTVEARAEGKDGSGRPVPVSPRWVLADPELATVSPEQGNEVRITALRPGESSLRLISDGVSRELALKAAYKGEVLQVEISALP
jgi:FKBP-type peptidyl-prolyl cis-trans isomerase